MIDRGFAVVNEGTNTIKDIMSFPRLCLVSLTMEEDVVTIEDDNAAMMKEVGVTLRSMEDDNKGRVRVRLASVDAPEDLVFTLPVDFSTEPPERFTSTSVIGGKCSSVWDCGDQVIRAVTTLNVNMSCVMFRIIKLPRPI